MFFLQKVQYMIDRDTKTCQKSVPIGPFQTIDIPATAQFVAEEWIGVEGLVGAGLQTELWMGTPATGESCGFFVFDIRFYASFEYMAVLCTHTISK